MPSFISIAEGQGTADPETLSLGGGDLVPDALGGDLPLELGKGQEHVERQPAHGGRGIELLGDRDKRHAVGIEQFDQLGEVRQRPSQTVDLVDDDDVDLPGADVVQQSLQVGAIGRPAGVSAIVIARSDQSPAGMGLTLYIGRGSIVLGIQRVELLIEPMVGGDPGVDGAANRFDRRRLHDRASAASRSSLSLRPKKRGPFHLVPVIAKATLERLSYVWPFQANPSDITITR